MGKTKNDSKVKVIPMDEGRTIPLPKVDKDKVSPSPKKEAEIIKNKEN